MRKLKLKINSFIKRKFSAFYYDYCFDNICTDNNLEVIKEKRFLKATIQAEKDCNVKINIPMRIHQAIYFSGLKAKQNMSMVEVGTGKGYTFSAILNYHKEKLENNKIFLIDSFLPTKPDFKTGEQKADGIRNKAYASSLKEVEKSFSKFKNVSLVQGIVPEILNKKLLKKIKKISFLHIDLNHHIPEIKALEILFPILDDNAIILLDDFANPGRRLQYQAHTNFFNKHGLEILTLSSGQGIVMLS